MSFENSSNIDTAILAAAVQQAVDAIFITDVEGIILYVNPAFENITGYVSSDIIGQNPRVISSGEHDQAFFEEMWETILRGDTWTGLVVNKTQDGSYYKKEEVIYPVRDNAGTIINFVGLIRDTSEEPGIQAQVQQSQKMEAIGQLASGIAHEINTPTQYIGDNLQFLREAFGGIVKLIDKYGEMLKAVQEGNMPSEHIEDIKNISDEIDIGFLFDETPGAIERALEGNKRVAEVVRAMKEFAHPGAEKMTLTDINHAIDNTIAVSRNEWKYVADIITNLDAKLPMTPCVPGPFNQVILNIIVNAAHAITDVVNDGSRGKGTITIATSHDDDEWTEIRISDTGKGISPDIAKRIYNPFFTTKDVGKGTGQGLAIARSVIVETHKGSLDFESEMGKGTTFIIRLPLSMKTE